MSEQNEGSSGPGPDLEPPPPGRRRPGVLLRTAAASSVLAAVSVMGLGAAAAPAQAGVPGSPEAAPSETRTGQAAGGFVARQGPSAAERLAGVRTELEEAVSWGEVSTEQAQGFYAQISSRIARGR
ncbi:hypothetical protein [Arthrobacter caoxuetaonis]|uniref:Uncharacterized protein n=1 Tax=Arthrobacter caoxuetaonis TaxID=2886935 RepID=A0A9X1MAW4_9MICC|nr:hypothetical protein [Arthrobacter caoxuetaonis]MCC3296483.1 hypothetical protein [Arthrobacter caoxuetaonis]USQ56683.1 hypothetical protein NF551_13170 [Arthrobacter caoxuetaonis]